MKNYINQYKQIYEHASKRIKDTHYKARLRDLKTWVQVKGPRPVQGILSYALDWLSPELIGTGFRMKETSDHEVSGLIPYRNQNLDSQSEIHPGLVVNAAIELARVSLQKQIPDEAFRIVNYEINLVKKNLWKEDLYLSVKLNLQEFDDFFIELQEKQKARIQLEVDLKSDHQKKHTDKIQLHLQIESILLIED